MDEESRMTFGTTDDVWGCSDEDYGTAMRGMEQGVKTATLKEERLKCTDSESDEGILWNDEDYETAEIIGNRLLLHMAAAFRLIDGDKQDVVPEIKPLDQRRVLFEQLKGEYSLGELISEAKNQGVSRSSAIRWNNQWIEQGLINKENHGNYRKVA